MEYGNALLAYFESGGAVNRNVLSGGEILLQKNLHDYGGLFDLLIAAANKYLNIWGEYEMRHVITSLFGFITIFFTGLLAKSVANWRTGCIALIVMFFSPRFLGHAMNNPKDIPFAAAYAFSLYFLTKYLLKLPKPGWKNIVMLIIGIAFVINTRIGGAIILFYFLGSTLLYIIYRHLREHDLSYTKLMLLQLFVITVTGYFLGLIFWPFGHTNPFLHPFQSLMAFSNLQSSASFTMLFEGKLLRADELPWYYIPKWMIITIPVVTIVGFGVGIYYAFLRKNSKFWIFIVLLFAGLFPLAYAIYKGSIVYDSWRHFTFIYPVIVVFAAMGWSFLINLVRKKYLQLIIPLVFLLLLFQPATWIIRTYPNIYVYFNSIAGGIENASKKFETDYWGNSIRYAAEWLAEKHKKEKRPKPLIYFTDASAMSSYYYLNKILGDSVFIDHTVSSACQYGILISRHRVNNNILGEWPPKDAIFTVKADDVVLCAVVENPNKIIVKDTP